MLTASQITDKWAANLGGSTQTIRQGVEAVQVNPAEKAIARKEAYRQGVIRAVDDGSYESGLRRVTLSGWKTAMINKGLSRIATGASEAKPKFQSFMQEFIPHLQAGLTQLESMPRGDINQNIARAVYMIQHNAEFRRSA